MMCVVGSIVYVVVGLRARGGWRRSLLIELKEVKAATAWENTLRRRGRNRRCR
jgi:hypothetical protein